MSRPLLNADIAKLERLYFTGERDCTQLRQLEHELEFRKTSRAEALARKVALALQKLTSGEVAVSVGPPVRPPSVQPVQPPPSSPPSLPPHAAGPPKPRAPAAPLTTELRDAYAALKLPPDAAWENIEACRRHIVAQASPAAVARLPSERVEELRTAAANANRAAALLGELNAKKR